MGQPVEHVCPAEAEARDPSQETRDIVSEVMAHADRHGSEEYPYAYRFLDVGCPEHLLEARAFKGTSEFRLTVVDLAGRVPADRGPDEGPFMVQHDAEALPEPENAPERSRWQRFWKGPSR